MNEGPKFGKLPDWVIKAEIARDALEVAEETGDEELANLARRGLDDVRQEATLATQTDHDQEEE